MADLSLQALARRAGTDGPATLLDDAVALIRHHPGVYFVGLPGALLLGVAVTTFVLLHRTLWLPIPLGELIPSRTVPAAVAVTLAFGLRGVGHGLVARRTAALLGQRRSPRWRPLSLFAGALIVPAASLPAALALLIPGVWVAGRFAPLAGFVGVQGRSVADGVQQCLGRPRREAWRAAGVLALALVLVAVILGNLLLGSLLGVQALRMLTGADTTGLARLASPGNEGFLVAATVLAAVVVDPILAIARGLLFLGASDDDGADGLARRWRDYLAGPVLLYLVLLSIPAAASAAEPMPLSRWVEHAHDAADRLTGLADGWEGAETIVLAPLRPLFEESLSGTVRLPSGELVEVRGRWLLESLPEKIDSPDAVGVARQVAASLELAAVEAAMLHADARQGLSPQRALADELAAGRYRLLRDPQGATRVRRPGFKQRLRAWWDALFAADAAEPEEPVAADPEPAGQWLVAVVAVGMTAGVVALLALLVRSLSRQARPAGAVGPLGPAPGVDARTRPSRSWLRDADRAAAAGDLSRAIHFAYLAVLVQEDAKGHIDAVPGATNGEHVRAHRGAPERAAQFARVTLEFDRLRYGGVSVTDEGWRALREQAEHLATRGDP